MPSSGNIIISLIVCVVSLSVLAAFLGGGYYWYTYMQTTPAQPSSSSVPVSSSSSVPVSSSSSVPVSSSSSAAVQPSVTTPLAPTTLAPVNYNNVNFTNKIIQSRVSSAPVCFDNYSGGNGAQLKLYQCSGTNGGGAGTNQWSTVTNNSIQVGNKCIDSLKDVPNQGDPIGLWDCNQGTHQNFEFDSTGHIKYHDTTGNTMCVNTPNSATANGTGLIFWPCQDGANSLWYQN
jgi:ricin-type beta-trefoil lectin protein